MYAVLLDACVLVPTALCDTVLRLAERGFYRPLWSRRILDEVKYAILAVHPEIDEGRVDARIAAMTEAFDDAMVVGWEQTCVGLDLPDPDDRHVLAAAIKGGAQSLVSFNLKDFPEPILTTVDVEVVHPDEFLLDQLDLYPGAALQVVTEQAAGLTSPPSDLAGVLNRLERCGVRRGPAAGPGGLSGAHLAAAGPERPDRMLGQMAIQRMDHVSVVVDDLAAAIAFFVELGMELEGEAPIEGPWVDRVAGLDGVRVDIAMLRTPDSHGRLELTKFHSPAAVRAEPDNAVPNALGIRSIMFAVDDIEHVIARLRTHGAELVGEVAQYEDSYRLCYVRGPEGIIVALAEPLS